MEKTEKKISPVTEQMVKVFNEGHCTFALETLTSFSELMMKWQSFPAHITDIYELKISLRDVLPLSVLNEPIEPLVEKKELKVTESTNRNRYNVFLHSYSSKNKNKLKDILLEYGLKGHEARKILHNNSLPVLKKASDESVRLFRLDVEALGEKVIISDIIII